MKKMKFILLLALGLMPFMQSCNDNEGDYAAYAYYATVHVPSTGQYFFTLDNGKTLYPGDISRIGNYNTLDKEGESKDGNRTVVYYNLLDVSQTGFDYNGAIYGIVDILSKPINVANTQEEVTAAGSDKIDILSEPQLIDGWLDLQFAYMTSNTQKVHKLTLLDNKLATPPANMPEDYVYLEFRHEADGDTSGRYGYGYVSYKLSNDYNPAITHKKGFYIRVDTYSSNDPKYMKIDFQK